MTISFTKSTVMSFINPGNSLWQAAVIDINGDNVSDIFIPPANYPFTEEELAPIFFLSKANVTFEDVSSNIVGGVSTVNFARDFITEDFNGDGIKDFFIADHGYDLNPWPGHQNMIYLSTSGNLSNGTADLPQQSDMTHSTGAGDVDGDGDLDIVVGNVFGENLIDPQIWINNGAGKFVELKGAIPNSLVDISEGSNTYMSQDLIDLNNDGLADLILGANRDHGSVQILYNTGGGVFTTVNHTFSGPYGTLSGSVDIDSLDINSDGRTDLMLTYNSVDTWAGAYTQIMVQRPDGSFADETASRLSDSTTGVSDARNWVQLADLDNDGDQDALVTYTGPNSRTPEIWTNENGVFSVSSLATNNVTAFLGDFDGNGMMDVVALNPSGFEILLNDRATDTIYGTDDGETISGTSAANSLYGNGGADTVSGGAGADLISGGAGDDILDGGIGSDKISGGEGTDTASFSVARSAASISESGTTVLVSDGDGTDVLDGIESYRFSDGTYQLSDLIAPTETDGGVYRFNNISTGTHFYTSSVDERNIIINGIEHFNYEGVSFVSPGSENSAAQGVHRFFNTQTGTHFFTISNEEKEQVDLYSQYTYEGQVFNGYTSEVDGSVPLYRFFNTLTGTHFYTPSEEEKDIVVQSIPHFSFEGTAYWVDVA